MTGWRLLDTGPLDGALNMAVDVALMERARTTGERVLRIYGWAGPTLSLGRNQAARDRYDRFQLEQRGVDVVRRPTGGRAILHWRELTYSVTAEAGSGSVAQATYATINEIILASLLRVGVQAEIAGPGTPRHPNQDPCFAEPSAGEIVARTTAGHGKLVGSAQFLEKGALLQHGSILLHDDQPLLVELTGEGTGQTHATSVSAALGRDVSAAEVGDALFATVQLSGGHVAALGLDEIRQQAEAHAPAFRDPLWTWRR
jgi:lipoyl(octanoyl) transferase